MSILDLHRIDRGRAHGGENFIISDNIPCKMYGTKLWFTLQSLQIIQTILTIISDYPWMFAIPFSNINSDLRIASWKLNQTFVNVFSVKIDRSHPKTSLKYTSWKEKCFTLNLCYFHQLCSSLKSAFEADKHIDQHHSRWPPSWFKKRVVELWSSFDDTGNPNSERWLV